MSLKFDMDATGSFLVSKRVAQQGRNMHVFSIMIKPDYPRRDKPQAILAGGFNLNQIPLTAATFYRWLEFSGCSSPVSREPIKEKVVLRRISLETIETVPFMVQGVEGPPIARDSSDPLEPGTYGIFSMDGEPYSLQTLGCAEYEAESFRDEETVLSNKYPGQNDIPADLSTRVQSRDQRRCCITGRTDLPTEIVWIYPPLSSYFVDGTNPVNFDQYKHVDNLVTVCTALVDPLQRNLISVDVEDNARIIIFDKITDDISRLLPTNLQTPLPTTTVQDFWRRNFDRTLSLYFPGGQAGPPDVIQHATKCLEQLRGGATPRTPFRRHWRALLGQEVMQEVIRVHKEQTVLSRRT
ncbi:hypothetical protein MIND_01302100 [Mycena indigotica]|uniref:Uncharacterized protein n=1 Tax=Mycena indigotica TaxID=2126181 RepID=A0A8H6VWC1_9AGAR|nr:uncharacterized protein MIND_01302100 [Mycena indigotica]KAF7290619.1 hypothetical protein MIND_01302100 [Mycena indigotica]